MYLFNILKQYISDYLLQRHAIFVREMEEDRMESTTFRKVALWQHVATYLLYFVMLMNVFVTTFGISGGSSSVFSGGRPGTSVTSPVVALSSGAAPVLLPGVPLDRRHTGY